LPAGIDRSPTSIVRGSQIDDAVCMPRMRKPEVSLRRPLIILGPSINPAILFVIAEAPFTKRRLLHIRGKRDLILLFMQCTILTEVKVDARVNKPIRKHRVFKIIQEKWN
jgi:hypothetical protein